jgi:hypothetical protein
MNDRRRRRNALVALREWAEQHDPGFAYLDALPSGTRDTTPPQPRRSAATRYGAPINYRGILLEPINEAGVIMLFGAMAQGWQDSRIEFEYESRNVQKHGHDPAAATSSSAGSITGRTPRWRCWS